ncbi:MAG: hypothetical protein BWX86_01421 [Verrucomicrobia bacterium ADurb.Bin122]|nr:MAG: hypothetical protein BWX86_01421 [Verrucomicrobia bacterium ADurb.Bin122]
MVVTVKPPIPVAVLVMSRPLMVTAEEVLPSSVTGTLRLFVPNNETLLNFSFVSAESCACSEVNSAS